MSQLASHQFKQEISFLYFTVPTLNSLLDDLNQPSLCVPKIVHYDSDEGKQVIFLEDMREKGFQRTDRMNALDMNHVKLVIEEYGRIHAASRMLFDKYHEETLKKFKLNEHPLTYQNMIDMIKCGMKSSIIAGLEVCGHRGLKIDAGNLSIASENLKNLDGNIEDVNFDYSHDSPFLAVIHHDCWLSNYMFR